mmetsp:Transcript_5913/g.18812  ORF Transcript_5913/g.18812 Transcript_5913/m.18812 type:complete len:217 (+) Transcript_5913:473-1123(+)
MNVRPLKPPPRVLRHELRRARVALAVVADKDKGKLRVERRVLAEVLRLFRRDGLHVTAEHHLAARLEVPCQHSWHGVESSGADEREESGVRRPLRQIGIDVRPCGEEGDVTEAALDPFGGAVDAQVQLAVQRQHTRVERLAREAPVDARGVVAAGAEQRVVDIGEDFSVGALLSPLAKRPRRQQSVRLQDARLPADVAEDVAADDGRPDVVVDEAV